MKVQKETWELPSLTKKFRFPNHLCPAPGARFCFCVDLEFVAGLVKR